MSVPEFTSRRQVYRHAVRWTWGRIMILWALFGHAARIRDNLLPEQWKHSLQTMTLIDRIPHISFEVWIIGSLLIVIAALGESAYRQIHAAEQKYFDACDEIAHLKSVPLQLNLDMKQVHHRRSTTAHWVWNGDIFLEVTAALLAPRKIEVTYAMDAIFEGSTQSAEWIADMDKWCLTKVVHEYDPFSNKKDEPLYRMDALATALDAGAPAQGWLHFKAAGIQESELAKCTLRLFAKSPNGVASVDVPAGSWCLFREDFKVVTKDDTIVYAERSHGNPQPPPL